MQVIRIQDNTCNEVAETLVLTRFPNLKKLNVGSGSLQNVKTLVLKGLSSLKEVVIGDGCFLSCRNTLFEGSSAFSS